MDATGYLAHLRRESSAFGECLRGDLTAAVRHCGRWTLYDLADHLGRGNLWAAVAVTEKRGDHEAPPAPRDPAALLTWFTATSDTQAEVLDADPSGSAWTLCPPPTVGFWQRRRCLETLVHRWDAENALGIGARLDPALADDGVAEVIDIMAPRQFQLGRARAPRYAVRFAATDTRSSWVLGPGEPQATVSATAADLLLLLWGRLSPDDPAVSWDGDFLRARALLDVALVP